MRAILFPKKRAETPIFIVFFGNRCFGKKNLDQIITSKRAKLGPDNNSTAYIYICLSLFLALSLSLFSLSLSISLSRSLSLDLFYIDLYISLSLSRSLSLSLSLSRSLALSLSKSCCLAFGNCHPSRRYTLGQVLRE